MIILPLSLGVGKSKTINVCAQYAEKYLRKAGDHPNRPRVLLLCPTGMAACLIGMFISFFIQLSKALFSKLANVFYLIS